MESVADAFKGSIGSLMKVLPDTCDKHSTEKKKVHMVKIIKTGEVMCPECYREQHIKPKLHAMEEEMITKKYRGYLRRYSLVDRKSTFDYSFDTFKYKTGSSEEQKYRDAREIAGFYYKNPQKEGNSLLYGTAGSGKTHLAMAVLNAINTTSKNPMQKCLFLSIPALIRAMRNYIADPVTNEWSADYLHQVESGANLVVIDDLGAESASREATNFVQETIQNIYEDNQRIITTTNLSMDQLKSTYHGRLISRILEGSRGKMIDFGSVSDKRRLK